MAMFVNSCEKLRKELHTRWLTLDYLLKGTPVPRAEQGRYRTTKPEDLRIMDAMAIRLAINDFKGILAEVAKIK